jgi:hypothetical protein
VKELVKSANGKEKIVDNAQKSRNKNSGNGEGETNHMSIKNKPKYGTAPMDSSAHSSCMVSGRKVSAIRNKKNSCALISALHLMILDPVLTCGKRKKKKKIDEDAE